MLKSLKTYQRISLHILFWMVVIGAFVLFYGTYNKNYLTTFITLLVTLPVDVSFTYFVLYFLIPRFLPKRKYFSFLFYFLLSNAVVLIGERALNLYVADPLLWPKSMLKEVPFWSISIFALS